MSRRTSRTRPVFSSWPVARWKRRLNCSFFRFSNSSDNWSFDIALRSEALCLDFMIPSLLGNALDEARLDRKLRRAEAQSLASDILGHAVDLEHDTARLHLGRPEFGSALALTHTHFGRLRRHRHVREDADPHPARALHGAGDGAAGRLDLASVDTLGFHRLQAKLAEVEVRAALRGAGDAALELLTELGFLRLQHSKPLLPLGYAACSRRPPERPPSSFIRLS